MGKIPKHYVRLSDLFIRKLESKSLSEIFYLSLFETAHFEQKEFYYNSDEIRNKIKKILKKNGKPSIRRSDINRVIDSQFFTGKITNIILSEQLSQILKKSVNPNAIINGYEIDCRLGSIALEIKRLYSTSNIYNYIKEEIDKYKKIKSENIKDILITFILIAKDEEEGQVLLRSVDGYRNFLDILQKKKIIPKNFHFYITTFCPNYNLDSFIRGLIEKINNLKT